MKKENKELWDSTFSKEGIKKITDGFPKMSDFLGGGFDSIYIRHLEFLLTSARSREKALREALEEIVTFAEYATPDVGVYCLRAIARKALEGDKDNA